MSDSSAFDCNLAEFNAIKAEISRRSGHQSELIKLNVVALSAIATLAFVHNFDNRVLLLIPIFSAMIGLCWTDHASAINMLAIFTRDSIKPKLANAACCGVYDIADYERIATSPQWGNIHLKSIFLGPIFILFGIVPIFAGLVPFILVDTKYDLIFWILLVMAAGLMYWFIVSFLPVATRSPKTLARFLSVLKNDLEQMEGGRDAQNSSS